MKIRPLVSVAIILIAMILVALQVRSSLMKNDDTKKISQKRVPVVETAPVIRKTIAHCLELTGTAEPYRQVSMASPAGGPVLKIAVREGDEIKVNELLLAIGRKEGVDALVSSLKDELSKEEAGLRRIKSLRESSAVSQEELEERQASYEKVKAAFIKAQETEQDHTIVSPWNGIVSRIFVKEGQFVIPHTPLLEIYDKTSIVIRSTIPEKNVSAISQGMKLQVHLDAYPDRLFTGEIKRIHPFLDIRLRAQTIEIELDESIPLLPGMFARIRLPLRIVQDAVVVPVDAIILTTEGWRVKLFQDGKAVAKPVETGVEDGAWIEILNGVDPGSQVIVKGNDVKDGMPVKIREQKTKGKTSAESQKTALSKDKSEQEGATP